MQGVYFDPLHGGCLRRVRRTSPRTYVVHGVYGDDEAPRTWGHWTATATVVSHEGDAVHLRVDFSGKPGKTPRVLTARYARRAICWEDGNVWTQLYVHPMQL